MLRSGIAIDETLAVAIRGHPPPGLERPVAELDRDWIESAPSRGGVELLRAWFAGRAYAKHRHDTYAICLTDRGVQAFDYRGSARVSGPGHVVVLHPDEVHDGRAGSDDGFGYRIVYVAPTRIAEAVSALCGASVPLPFVRDPVLVNARLAAAVADAFESFPTAPEPLAFDAVVERLARGLVEADPAVRRRRLPMRADAPALERVRQFLEAERLRVVSTEEIERIAGHGRYALARQFRAAYGTSPYRYLLMRRLDWVRHEIRAGRPLASIAAEAGFADQPHMTRVFKATYGLAPAQFRAVARAASA